MKTLEAIFCGHADATLISRTFAGISTTFAALAALSFFFSETPTQISVFFTVALVSMGFACAAFPFRASQQRGTVATVDNDSELEELAQMVKVLQPAR